MKIRVCLLALSLLMAVCFTACSPKENTGSVSDVSSKSTTDVSSVESSVSSEAPSGSQDTSSEPVSSETVSINQGDNVFVDDWEI